MTSSVVVSGPLFDGRAARAVTDFRRELEYEVSWQAFAEARRIMDASFRHPTPYYEVQVTNQRIGEEQHVHDRGIIYGPWLETGHSPHRTTRFRGYHSFRRATQAVLPKVVGLANHVLQRFIGRM